MKLAIQRQLTIPARVFGLVGTLSGVVTAISLMVRYEPFVTPGLIFASAIASATVFCGLRGYLAVGTARAALISLVVLAVTYPVIAFLLLGVSVQTAELLRPALTGELLARISFFAGLVVASIAASLSVWFVLSLVHGRASSGFVLLMGSGFVISLIVSVLDLALYYVFGLESRDRTREAIIVTAVFLVGNTIMAGAFGSLLTAERIQSQSGST